VARAGAVIDAVQSRQLAVIRGDGDLLEHCDYRRKSTTSRTIA